MVDEVEIERMGVMLYGYDGASARVITDFLTRILGRRIESVSGSGRESDTIEKILDGSRSDAFEDRRDKVLMFLGFDDDQICRTMDAFPKDGRVGRPIFCTLTENNLNWPLSELIEHLLEERRCWDKGNVV
jgi:hypothetical protein